MLHLAYNTVAYLPALAAFAVLLTRGVARVGEADALPRTVANSPTIGQ